MSRILAIIFLLTSLLGKSFATTVTEVRSQKGLSAWLVKEHSIPFVALEVRIKGGTTLDRDGKRGAVYLMSALMNEGAGDLDSSQFSAEMERLALKLDFDVYQDSMSISVKFLTENKDEAIDFIKMALLQPRFDNEPIERVRSQIISILGSNSKDPNKISSKVFFQKAFPNHPYGSGKEGSIETVSLINREDILNAYFDVFNQKELFISAVGDISESELSSLIDEIFGSIPISERPMIDRAKYSLGGGSTVVDYDTPQSVVIFGQKGIKRDDSDFFPAYVLNHILGGSGFGSKLMQELREKNGLTYGISTYLVNWENADLLLGQFSSSNDTAYKAVNMVKDVWKELVTNGVSSKELEDAKTFLIGAYPLRFDGNSRIANILVGMQMQGLSVDYIKNRNKKINDVSLEDLKRVASKILIEDELHFVIVGRPTS